MNKLRHFIHEHYIAIVLGCVLAFVSILPQVYLRIDHRDDGVYQGIELIPDSPWSPRIREMQDGNGFGSIYFHEGKDDPYLFQPLGAWSVAKIGNLFSLDINNTILLSRIILSFLSFLFLYIFVFLTSREKYVALLSASVLLFAESMLSVYGIKQFLSGLSPDDFLRIARPLNPGMIYILLFGALISLWFFYKKRDFTTSILSSVCIGLNFYNYFYTWTYLFAFGGLLTLFHFFHKEWKRGYEIMFVYIGALIVAVPYGFNLLGAMMHPAYTETGIRFGIVETHQPLFVGYMVILALILFVWKFPREDRVRFNFGLALLLTPFITLNQQLITGKVLQATHYHWFFHKPVAIIFIAIIVFSLLKKSTGKTYYYAGITLVIALSIFFGFFVQIDSYFHGTNDGGAVLIQRQKYGPVIDWLNTNAPADSVIFGNNETSHITAIYTPFDVFYHRSGMYTLSETNKDLMNRMFVFYRLRGVGASDVSDTFFTEREFLSWNIYGMHYRELLGSYEAIPYVLVEESITAYKKTLSVNDDVWLLDIWKEHGVNYIVWDTVEDPTWDLDRYAFLEQVASFDTIVIYTYKNISS